MKKQTKEEKVKVSNNLVPDTFVSGDQRFPRDMQQNSNNTPPQYQHQHQSRQPSQPPTNGLESVFILVAFRMVCCLWSFNECEILCVD